VRCTFLFFNVCLKTINFFGFIDLEKSINEQNKDNPSGVEENYESLETLEEKNSEEKLEMDSIERPLKK